MHSVNFSWISFDLNIVCCRDKKLEFRGHVLKKNRNIYGRVIFMPLSEKSARGS